LYVSTSSYLNDNQFSTSSLFLGWNLVPETVTLSGTSRQRKIPGKIIADSKTSQGNLLVIENYVNANHLSEVYAIRLFDYITGNRDRWVENVLISRKGDKLWAIDNEDCMLHQSSPEYPHRAVETLIAHQSEYLHSLTMENLKSIIKAARQVYSESGLDLWRAREYRACIRNLIQRYLYVMEEIGLR
jgi:hypothetical protein